MLDAITTGSATVDVFAVISKKVKQISIGDKVLIDDLDIEVGGGGVNSAVALRRMGLKTAFLGKLGHDHNAFKILHELKKEHVKIIKTAPSKEKSSYSFILTSTKEKDRIIYTFKGASDELSWNEIPKSQLKTKWLYMATMMGESFKTCKRLAAYAKEKGIKLMFNPSTYLAAKGKEYLKPILSNTNILVLNKKEAKLLLNKRTDSIRALLKSLKSFGLDAAVVTDGKKGVHAYDGKRFYYAKAPRVKVVSTAGAGDAFASGFLAAVIKGNDVETALRIGSANAGSVIQYYGTKNRLLSYEQALKERR